ncbi:MAG TPA: UvrD-helicase domain-containing protein [Vicinamibacterales bacterium]|nr:UvrD-helicase domain-containing protein [Vicinamibacterales bacterium]
MSEQGLFDFDTSAAPDPQVERDRAARQMATDPLRSVALEASAGTGKTRVLVERYVRLVVEAGVHPRHILAMTFTRKAAAEMRQRVLETLKARHREGALTAHRWRQVRDAFAEITISTIDAFCLSLLHEFPLEAGVDPGFDLADETETPRLVNSALDRTLRRGRAMAETQPEVALLFAELGEFRIRQGLSVLLDRRLVAWDALHRFLHGRTPQLDEVCDRARQSLRGALQSLPGGARAFVDRGPGVPAFALLAHDVRRLASDEPLPAERLRAALDRLQAHVLTDKGLPRQRLAQRKADFRSAADYEAHKAHVLALGPSLLEAVTAFRRDLNVVLAHGVRELFVLARREYRRTLDKHGVLDFSDVLERALALLEQRDEFSRSRFKLEARYRHVLVDEFQDTSRAQWRLVRELMSAWTEGAGPSEDTVPPSIFIVGDRKQSIYGFRDAEVTVLEDAARHIDALRPDRPARAAITRSHRAVLPLLHFVNDVFEAVEKQPQRPDAFRYSDDDRFPLATDAGTADRAVGLVCARADTAQADAVADEIARLLDARVAVRDRSTGARRPIAPGDVAVLFRTREGHRLVEQALARRGVPFYVYKGLGFFDADETKDVLALLGFFAEPSSHLRAAALLRSRVVRVSDAGLKALAPDLAGALSPDGPALPPSLPVEDAIRLALARDRLRAWLPLVDRQPPAELVDRVLAESAYVMELDGPGMAQARENVKKIRALVRRIQNRGYATVGRLVEHFSQLVTGGDESNAIIDAVDAVNLMTVHAAKGLEYPVVFVVNLGRGSGGGRAPIRVTERPAPNGEAEPVVGIGDHTTDADADAEARESEETKRLLYVALTRARDRLYLAATLNDEGRFAPLKGSLGRLLPVSLHGAIATGATGEPVLWAGPSATHQLHVVVPGPEPVVWHAAPVTPALVERDFSPLPPDGTPRVSPAAAEAGAAEASPRSDTAARSSPVLGTLVHRLLAEARARGLSDADALAARAQQLASGDGELDEVRDLVARAVVLCRGVLSDPGVQALFERGTVVFEAAYSRRLEEGCIERGAIDCLVVGEAVATVVEFKTGAPRAAHQDQLAAYLEAVRGWYPGRRVEGHLVYVGPP